MIIPILDVGLDEYKMRHLEERDSTLSVDGLQTALHGLSHRAQEPD